MKQRPLINSMRSLLTVLMRHDAISDIFVKYIYRKAQKYQNQSLDFQLVLELTKGCFSMRVFEFICHVWNSVELKQEIKFIK